MIDMNTGRTWSNAPAGVRNARALAWLGVIVYGFFFIFALMALFSGGLNGAAGSSIFMMIFALFFPFYIWLLSALKKGVRAAYSVQMILSILGLLGFPLGTIINGYILYQWSRPETKAWFGV